MSEIVCPHCGSTKKVLTQNKIINCDFCGSSLSDIAKEFLYNAEEEKKQQKVTPPVYQNMPSFPISQKLQKSQLKSAQPRQFPFRFRNKPSDPTPSKEAFLYFPQINQKVIIPSNESIFHFGRNTILPLVNPNEFDVEWLNSISRVRKQDHQINKYHFLIKRDKKGLFSIEDTESRWGTWLNRQQIKGKGNNSLRNGDKIELMLSKPNIKNVFPFVIKFNC